MLASALSHTEPKPRARFAVTHELVLAVLLAVEIGVFSVTGRNFATPGNLFDILRLSVETGLLAVAMTPVIVTGGIDLSVGSLMTLSAVLFGKLTGPAGVPWVPAAILTLAAGAAAGGLNALLVTRLRIPPLIVTLGSFSLFRGLAEGWTGGSQSFSCPEGFLFMGKGLQIPLFLAVAAAFWVLLHRTTVGRSLYAIGRSPEGARYAGIPVTRRLALVYVLSGLMAALAALVYVSRYTQARADAGEGFELMAITAVVLGGTSIFGGSGKIHGTLLGLFAIQILDQGMKLSDASAQVGRILVGVLLVAALLANRFLAGLSERRST